MRTEKDIQELEWDGVVVEDTDEEWQSNDQTAEERLDENAPNHNEPDLAPLFNNNVAEQFRAKWLEIQTLFVDNPTTSVEEASELVTQVIEKITDTFAEKQITLENQLKQADKISTEDLRLALKRYRSFFNRLLALEC